MLNQVNLNLLLKENGLTLALDLSKLLSKHALEARSAEVEKHLIRFCPIFEVVLYPQVHIGVEKHVLRLLLHHIATLLS